MSNSKALRTVKPGTDEVERKAPLTTPFVVDGIQMQVVEANSLEGIRRKGHGNTARTLQENNKIGSVTVQGVNKPEYIGTAYVRPDGGLSTVTILGAGTKARSGQAALGPEHRETILKLIQSDTAPKGISVFVVLPGGKRCRLYDNVETADDVLNEKGEARMDRGEDVPISSDHDYLLGLNSGDSATNRARLEHWITHQKSLPAGGSTRPSSQAAEALAGLLPTWFVSFEVRKNTALGVFGWTSRNIKAATGEEANEILFKALHDEGYETRGSQWKLRTGDENSPLVGEA